jgi:hypothetical protein
MRNPDGCMPRTDGMPGHCAEKSKGPWPSPFNSVRLVLCAERVSHLLLPARQAVLVLFATMARIEWWAAIKSERVVHACAGVCCNGLLVAQATNTASPPRLDLCGYGISVPVPLPRSVGHGGVHTKQRSSCTYKAQHYIAPRANTHWHQQQGGWPGAKASASQRAFFENA